MKTLTKTNNQHFNEYYEGTNGSRTVRAILDNNCVRYMIIENGKLKSKREFGNDKKDLCMKNATKALNK